MKCNMIINKVIKIRVKRRSKIVLGIIDMMIIKMRSKMRLKIMVLERVEMKLKLS